MQLTQAVVMAGGSGRAQKWPDLGLAAPQLAPVANTPVLAHHLQALAEAGVREVALVADALTSRPIRDAVGDGSDWRLKVHHVEADGGVADAALGVLCDLPGDGPAVLQHADVLLRERMSSLLEEFVRDPLDALVLRPAATGTPEITRFARGASGLVIHLDRKSSVSKSALRDAGSVAGLVQRMRADGARVAVRAIDACLPCRGGTAALLEANRRFLDDLPWQRVGDAELRSQVQGRVRIDPTAQIRSSLIRGPVVIGPRARITDAYVGPYTAIGADVEIDGVSIEHSVVLPEARIRFLGARLHDSVIGVRAHVCRDFALTRAISLAVGQSAEVSLG